MNSRSKGKRGELDFAKYLVRQLEGHTVNGEQVVARRGQQFRGGQDKPDVITNVPRHFEVKRTERLRMYEAVEQAVRDGGDKAVVAHKANHKPWLCIMMMDQFLELLVKSGEFDKQETSHVNDR